MKGKTMTPEARAQCLGQLKARIADLITAVSNDLTGHLCDEADKLNDAELLEITRGNQQHFRGARCLLLALGPARLYSQFQCDSIVKDTRRVARWLRWRQ